MKNAIQGILPALVTPFDGRDRVDENAIATLVDFHVRTGVHGLHPGGTTGEAALLTLEERKLVTDRVVEAAGGRVPVVAQVGHIRTRDAVELAEHALGAGADAISVVAPYYYQLPERALLAYFASVAEAVPETFPVYLYNIPQSTRNPVSPTVLRQVRDRFPNVRGLKHSEPDIDMLGAYLATGEDVQVFVGSDGLVLAGLAMGAVGAVSGNANVAPELFVGMYEAWSSGRIEDARRHQQAIAHVADLLGSGTDLARFKEGLRLRGVPVGTVRSPLAQLDGAAKMRAAAAVEAVERIVQDLLADGSAD